MPEDTDDDGLSERVHRGLYSLFIGAQVADRTDLTTDELYDAVGEFKGVTLLKSKQDAAALLSDFRDRGLAEAVDQEGRAYRNKLTQEGIDLLADVGKPEAIEEATEEEEQEA